MAIDLKKCDQACLGCVKSYKTKHSNKQKFSISCSGIPKEYIPEKVLATLDAEDASSALSVLDPVTWAGRMLDWHCLDLDGSVWKRKSEDDTLPQGCPNYYSDVEASDQRIAAGKSPFHRPYQAEMLRCTAKRKVFRIGRQAGKSEALIVAMLYAIYTNKDFKVILLTPFQSQISMIFKRIKEHLSNNPVLENSKKRLVHAPNYELELYNGSYVRGFTAGTSSNTNAAQARGQSAHMLVFDEADYLSEGDIGAVLATVVNNPEATIWMSSTPSGKREKFYESCKSPLYKEFFYPSHVNPNWNETLEAYFRSEYTEIQYVHEILAEFGEQEEGVFQAQHVEAAEAEYEYQGLKRQPHWQYCIGVDWNDVKVGTTIVVTGWNPHEQRFEVVDKQIVSRHERTQILACERIIEMNRKWIPEYIYIDRGYGGTQYEILKQYGNEALNSRGKGPLHVDARLASRVKQYDFGSQLEIRDLHTKQPVKKHAKPFLVETAVRKFENRAILFPKSDEQLKAELLGYIIDRVTTTGIPVFKQGNDKVGDHTLDALMMSLVAFELEMTEFGKPKFNTGITFSGHFGERVEPILYEGEGMVKQDEQYARRKQREAQKPELGRAKDVEENTSLIPNDSDKLPAKHTTREQGNSIRLWSWPGFNRDKPKPSRNKGVRKTDPPKRSKF